MSDTNQTFILYTNYYDILKDLSNDEIGIIFRAILEYAKYDTLPELSGSLKLAFNFIKNQIDYDKQNQNTINSDDEAMLF